VIHVVWGFVVREGCLEAFLRAYGPDGDWARLFARHDGFRGTTLLRDVARPRVYRTVDAWDSVAHRAAMLERDRAGYDRLDAACADLTESETEIGTFDVVG
jgi:hypothetical protein